MRDRTLPFSAFAPVIHMNHAPISGVRLMQQVNTAAFSAEANSCYQYAGFANLPKRYDRFSIAVLVTRHTIKLNSHFIFGYRMIGKRAKILNPVHLVRQCTRGK